MSDDATRSRAAVCQTPHLNDPTPCDDCGYPGNATPDRAAKYRKRPVVIEAMKWIGRNTDEIFQWLQDGGEPDAYRDGMNLVIPTLEGDHAAQIGDFIIKGVQGEFYPCKPDIFEATYEPA